MNLELSYLIHYIIHLATVNRNDMVFDLQTWVMCLSISHTSRMLCVVHLFTYNSIVEVTNS